MSKLTPELLAIARRKMTPLEHEEQAAVIAWCGRWQDKYPQLGLIFAIPNGAYKSKAAAAKFRREGLRPGVPDLFLPWPARDAHGLFVEMKRRRKSIVSEDQAAWIEALRAAGYEALVCEGSDEAIAAIENYLGITTGEVRNG